MHCSSSDWVIIVKEKEVLPARVIIVKEEVLIVSIEIILFVHKSENNFSSYAVGHGYSSVDNCIKNTISSNHD